jgi:hypothetical protein
MDWIAMKGIAEYVTGVLDAVLKRSAATQEQIKKAVAELQAAVLETLQYVSSLEGGKPPDRQAEAHLVSLWKVAAGAFYGIDGTLAERLQLKAEYWTNPESWTGAEVREAGIALDHVAELTRQLLYESKPKKQ